MKFEPLSEQIIGAAIEVHKILGPGMLESAYEECLAFELGKRNLTIERQKPVPVKYKDLYLKCAYKIDILVEEQIIVELKVVDKLLPVHQAQILTYMRFSAQRIGLLINFNETLLNKGIKRFVL